MREKETFWYPCPDCGEKMLKVRRDTVLISFPAYCKHCKDTKIITVVYQALFLFRGMAAALPSPGVRTNPNAAGEQVKDTGRGGYAT